MDHYDQMKALVNHNKAMKVANCHDMMVDRQSKMVEIAASSIAHTPAGKMSEMVSIPLELFIHTPIAKNTERNVENVTDDNVSLLKWSELIANDGGNLKDGMPPHQVIDIDDGNLKDDLDLVEAPTNDINYGVDVSCKEGDNDVTQRDELLSRTGVDDNLILDNNLVAKPSDPD
jgi:hypothetical protein